MPQKPQKPKIIGTLSMIYPANDNYGAYLQGYALCRAINGLEGGQQ